MFNFDIFDGMLGLTVANILICMLIREWTVLMLMIFPSPDILSYTYCYCIVESWGIILHLITIYCFVPIILYCFISCFSSILSHRIKFHCSKSVQSRNILFRSNSASLNNTHDDSAFIFIQVSWDIIESNMFNICIKP